MTRRALCKWPACGVGVKWLAERRSARLRARNTFISTHIGNAPELDEKNSTSVKTAVEVFLRKYFEQKSERVSSFACFI
jgi:hypothetical protein